ncbi:MAG: hypothetical protein H6737_20810 [Alphaproteobacteria bacterium]|nr:hypothetical protein [Alphaproteobacteria bacterium]
MTEEIPIDPTTRDALREPIESWAAGGDFDAAWTKARAGRPTRWVAPLALAATALLVLGIPARQAWEARRPHVHAGGAVAAPSIERAADWTEPVPLRYPSPPPTIAAAPHLRDALRGLVAGSATWPGDWRQALEATPEPLRPELYDRQSQAAILVRDFDRIREAGKRGTPVGHLLAAEVHLVDLETDAALPLFRSVKDDPIVGPDAARYLAMLDQGRVGEGLSEVTALFLLGDERTACDHVAEIWPEADDRLRSLATELSPGLARCAVP